MNGADYTEDFQNSIQLHGHACIGLAVGYVAAMTAMKKLGLKRAQDEELVTIAECDACGVDAIQAVLGCTLGKGNLIYRDHGKNVFTVIDRRQKDAIRIALNIDLFARTDEQQKLMEKVISGLADETERKTFWRIQQEKIDAFLAAPPEKSFSITRVTPEAPGHARLFSSLLCEACGEQVMEPRVRLREGKKVCIPCSESYSRGW